MNKKIIKANNKYRVIEVKRLDDKEPFYNSVYKVQVKKFLFWITIKEFEQTVYDESAEFCCNEAEELYNNIVNPYGRF